MPRSKDEIAIDLITNILREEGRADIMPGQVLRDSSINAQAAEIETLYSLVDNTAIAQSISNANFMTQNDLDNLLSNFGIKRRGATKAIGQVTFYTRNLPSQIVSIPKDTMLGTNIARGTASEVKFLTRFDASFDPSVASSYWNTVSGQWEITVDIIASVGGVDGNIGSYAITQVQNINTPFSVTNYNPTSGGTDQESNETFASRALNIILGSNAGTRTGYAGLASQQDNVFDSLVVGPGEDLMTRDGGFGGKVDIWIVPSPSAGYTTLDSNSNSLLSFDWQLGVAASEAYIFNFPQKPLNADGQLEIRASVSPSGVSNALLYEYRNPAPFDEPGVDQSTSGTSYHYTVYKATDMDTGNSIYANDFIEWNPDAMEYLRKYNPSAPETPENDNIMTVNITYSYTNAVVDLQTVLDGVDVKILTADVLAKEAEKILINVEMDVQLFPDNKTTLATEEETVGRVELAIVDTINNIVLGNQIQESDIIAAAHNVDGVDNIIISSVKLTKSRSAFFDTEAEPIVDDNALSNQYFIANNIVVRSV